MIGCDPRDLVLAIDYYDGEIEGLARRGGQCYYFSRVAKDVADSIDSINKYISVIIDCALFEDISDLLKCNCCDGVFVYSGSSNAVNKKLDEIIPILRLRLGGTVFRSQGHTFLDSMKIK